jgi:nucleoid-associated protein YgaU
MAKAEEGGGWMRSTNAKNLGRAAGIMVGLVWALSGTAAVAQETAPTDYEVAALAPKAGDADVPKAAPAGGSRTDALASDNDPHAREVYSKNVERVKRIKSLFGKLKQQVETVDTAQTQVSNLPKELPPEAMEIDEEPMPGQGASVLDEAPAPAKKSKKSKKGSKTAVAAAEKTYKVKKGDTLAKIAKKLLGSTKKANLIAKANGLPPGSALKPGRELVIPGTGAHIADADLGDVAVGEAEAPAKEAKASKKASKKKGPSPKNPNSEPVLDYSNYEFSMYTVKSGDTIGKISKAFYDNNAGGGDLIRRYNKLGKGDTLALKPGEKLLIPLPKQKKSDDRYEKAKKGIF